MTKLSQARKATAYHFTQPMVRFLARTPITPSALTWFGFLLAIGAAALIATEHLLIAGLVVLVAGFFDMLDGALARHTNQTTHFGAVLDSTLDRLSEGVLLLGILTLYAREPSITGVLLAGAALLGSPLVSYIRARGEALGLECQVGLFTRPERVVVLALGLLLSHFNYALIIALAIIVVFSFITAGQRLVHLWRQTKNR
ncbi:MAG: CDP-alcohol phosphatidyltransferase family protein [Dehalococcoidia bacterium]|nr:MAG: CDP-alcohol phosphatidyltransferase family protein [Dehalococcoidia bacterium]